MPREDVPGLEAMLADGATSGAELLEVWPIRSEFFAAVLARVHRDRDLAAKRRWVCQCRVCVWAERKFALQPSGK